MLCFHIETIVARFLGPVLKLNVATTDNHGFGQINCVPTELHEIDVLLNLYSHQNNGIIKGPLVNFIFEN